MACRSIFRKAAVLSRSPSQAAGLLLWLALLGSGGVAPGYANPSTVLTVQTVLPQSQTWPVLEQASGTIAPWQESVVAAELGGVAIIELAVDVGSVVQRGQLLLRLSQKAIQASRAQQAANVAKAKAALSEAEANAKRARTITGSGALSEQQITQLLSAEESARAGLMAAEAALQLEEVRLAQTEIVAADGGIIATRTATLGSVVQPGAELFRLIRQGRLEWRAELTAEQLLAVRPGQRASLTLSDGQQVAGTVRLLAPTLDPSSRKAIAYVDLPPETPARAGMFAQGEIQRESKAALVLPATALVLRDGNRYLFSVDKEGLVQQLKVTTGRRQGEWVEIVDGLAADTRVVAAGGAFLKQGDRVRVLEDAANGTAASKTAAP
ncbi:MAG: efflux RND transporter periplasmic adaptor subunit [Magnetococcales bacterium]|nr:efflux RND transporter periplasmic adaptor subunit [Magnetococcales bacterium]